MSPTVPAGGGATGAGRGGHPSHTSAELGRIGGTTLRYRGPMALVILALVVAAAAAVRSTWSPCGLSMLSTITPMAERARGHRYGVTATWFVVGAALGGATLGLGAGLLAAGTSALDLSTTGALGIAAVLAAAAALVDAGTFGRRPPFFRRQVDDAWLARYRAWVYGGGFGWQIGVGLATYIMTAGVVLTVALAVLTGSPAAAFAIALAFGIARGLVVLLGARLRSPQALGALHARLDALEAPVRWALVGLQAGVGAIAALLAWGPLAAAVVLAACAVGVAVALPAVRLRTGHPAPTA